MALPTSWQPSLLLGASSCTSRRPAIAYGSAGSRSRCSARPRTGPIDGRMPRPTRCRSSCVLAGRAATSCSPGTWRKRPRRTCCRNPGGWLLTSSRCPITERVRPRGRSSRRRRPPSRSSRLVGTTATATRTRTSLPSWRRPARGSGGPTWREPFGSSCHRAATPPPPTSPHRAGRWCGRGAS